MKLLDRLRSRTAAFVHDLLLIPVAWLAAYWLRFNLEAIPPEILQTAVRLLPIVIVVQGGFFWYFGLYRGIWRFASMPDLIRITKAVVLGTAVIGGAVFLITYMYGVPRSVFPIYALLLFVSVGGPRFAYRWLKDHKLYRKGRKQALIVGAGKAGEMLVRDLLRDQDREYEPTGFVDDNPKKHGQEIHGVRVIGDTEDIPRLISGIDVVLIALPSARSRQMRRIVGICEKTGVPFRTLPKMEDFVTGRAAVKALRDVKIDDLLGREAVRLQWDVIRERMQDRSVLVTGGGGSIGSELCRQIARLQPRLLTVYDQSEFNLYSIERELRAGYPRLSLDFILGDVGDPALAEETLRRAHPDVIFHAAAYKHVPMLEERVRSAVRNNVVATRNIARLAEKYDCKTFILVSTDKAVNPTSVMGATKYVAEVYCQSLNERSQTHFITVRFGNVLGSAGSVIPLFQRQIAEGGPVTVTDPNVTRYFMTIPEAAQLILQAGSVGQGGEIYVLDMGEPVNIKYLAEQLILLSGKRPGDDIEILYIGLRPGEKPHEELFHRAEEVVRTPHPKTLLARSRKLDFNTVQTCVEVMAQACRDNDEPRVRQLLFEFVELAPLADQPGESLVRAASE